MIVYIILKPQNLAGYVITNICRMQSTVSVSNALRVVSQGSLC